jgi:hypothetical protein
MSSITDRRRSSTSNYRTPDPVVEAAHEMRLQPETVHQLIYGRNNVFDRGAVIVRQMVEAGEGQRAAKLWQRILDAAEAGPTPDLSDALKDRNKEIEQSEDRSEVRYERNPSDENALKWYNDLGDEIGHNMQLRRALRAKHSL